MKAHITKTYLYNFHPFKSHFYKVKLGFSGVHTIILISAQNHRLWVLVRTAFTVLSRNMKNISYLSENFQFFEVKFSIYLNRRVFVICSLIRTFIAHLQNQQILYQQLLKAQLRLAGMLGLIWVDRVGI